MGFLYSFNRPFTLDELLLDAPLTLTFPNGIDSPM